MQVINKQIYTLHNAGGQRVEKTLLSPTLSTLGITPTAFPLINRPNDWKQKEFLERKI